MDRFADLMDLSRDRSRLDSYFGRTASAPVETLPSAAQSHHSGSTLEPESPSASLAQCTGNSEASPDADCKPSLVGGDSSRHDQSSAVEETGADDAVSLKREHSCGSGHEWECDVAFGLYTAEDAAGHQSDDLDWSVEDEQTLPMRGKPKLVPEHAHSAPAVLSPQSKRPKSSPSSAAGPACVAGLSHMQGVDQPPQVASVADEHSPQCDTCYVGAQSDSPAAIAQLQAGNDQGLPAGARQSHPDLDIKHVPDIATSCLQAAAAVSQPVSQTQHNLSLLDGVDIIEQSRILCQIQQQHLYAKHCLTSKKRQLTLGCFVAPKRLK